VANCTFTDNSASYGGGIFDDYGSGTLSNCTFENNSAEIKGGGLYGEVSEMNLIDCLMAGNSAGVAGGGMFHWALPDRETYSTGTGLSLCGNSPENISIHEDCDCGYVGTYTCQSALADCSDCDDSDGDGVPDFMDACPGGDDSVDSDDDGTPDGCDGCPNDPNKTDPGSCGCGVVDTNVNGDLDCDGDYDEDDVRAAMADFGITEGTPGDMDGDDDVDAADFVAVRDQVGVEALGCLVADINGDGQVDGADFAYVLGYWGLCSAP
jgi:predicted outer membrane repeat protein